MASSPSGCLVLMCGHPASGKSTCAADIARRIEATGARVMLVDEPSLHLPRNASYQDARSEKNTRGLLKATVERAVHRDGPVVILDANNGIKGYRYELWCIARQAGTRFCVIHCETPVDDARRWNEARRDRAAAATTESCELKNQDANGGTDVSPGTFRRTEWGGYDDDIFDDLVFRFERPDGKNRWDAPLFALEPEDAASEAETRNENENENENASEISGALNDEMLSDDAEKHGFPRRESLDGYRDTPTREQIVATAVRSIVGANSQGNANGVGGAHAKNDGIILRAVSKSSSTQPATKPSDASLRHDVDSGAQDIIDAIVRFDADSGGLSISGQRVYEFGKGAGTLRCPKAPSLQVLRRLKRAFIKIACSAVAGNPAGARVAARRLFVEHVQRDLTFEAF
jgi:protein KTI12